MQCRLNFKPIICVTIVLISLFSGKGYCQSDFEKTVKMQFDSLLAPGNPDIPGRLLLPNDAPQTISVPSGWGGYGAYLFGGIAGVYPQAYQTKADLIASGGACYGDPFKAVNVAASINLTDVHRFRDFSGNITVSRVIFGGNSISAGGLQLLASKQQSDSPQPTFFFAFSHAVQSLLSSTPGTSKLTYTIGMGNGRFYLKSPADIAAGRKDNGTAVFASVAYEILPHINAIAEWSGVNLGLSAGIRPFKNPLSLGLGVYNITRFSSDKPSAIFTLGYPLSLNRKTTSSN